MKSLYAENGKPSGTKLLLSLVVLAVVFRIVAGAFGMPEIDLTAAGVLLGTLGATYAGRRATEAFKPPAGVSTGRNVEGEA